MKNKPLAAIDIGTNTFRLLIGNVQPDSDGKNYTIKEIHSDRIITRLGEGVSESGLINKKAMARGISALKKFSNIISRNRVHKTAALATSALRDAKNSAEFLKKVRGTTGLKIKIISGREEAKKTASGMIIGITPPETALMADIGGGSTELILTRQKRPLLAHSVNLGVVHLADKYMTNDPPLKKDWAQMEKEIFQKIISITKPFKKLFSKDTVFMGTAGTVTTLAAITLHLAGFNHGKIHNSKIPIKKIRNISNDISTITRRQRAKYHPFEPARLDIIVPGTFILLKLMETFGFKEVIVSDYGLREGILLDIYRKSLKDSKKISELKV
ncbi:MAG: Ppx/GppA family phosphatase [Candidatus Mariimomonas ferrooxydans]